MSESEPIITKLNEINAFIHEAQIDLGQGKAIKLTHLDAQVAQICDQALILPPAEAKKVQPVMAEMIGKLDTLAASLKSFQTEMKEKLD